jgi:hypothetical protein
MKPEDELVACVPFRGPAADSAIGELLLDVLPLACAVGFAVDLAHCRALCSLTRRVVQRGDTADMMACALELQAGSVLRAARAAPREDVPAEAVCVAPDSNCSDGAAGLAGLPGSLPPPSLLPPTPPAAVGGTAVFGAPSLVRAALRGDEARARLLVRLGAPLRAADASGRRYSALHWACELGHENVARALLEGRFEGDGAAAALLEQRTAFGATALALAGAKGREGVVRLLLACGARQEPQNELGNCAMHASVAGNHAGIVALLCGAPGAATALALRDRYGRTPLRRATEDGHAAVVALLKAAELSIVKPVVE